MRHPPLHLLCLIALLAAAPANAERDLREFLTGTPIEDKVDQILAGERVTNTSIRSGEREMAVGFACLVPPGRAMSLDRFRNPKVSMPERFRDEDGPIDIDDLAGSLAAVKLGNRSEARRYLGAKPGWELSLSTEEIAAFQALGPPAGGEVAAVEGELRKQFAERIRRFHEQGLAGIAPFDRGDDGSTSAASDLEATTKAIVPFQARFPQAHEALLRFPQVDVPETETFYYWARVNVLGRPVFLLSQRAVGHPDGVEMMVDRQFYATQFVGAAQTITALVPVNEGTLVLLLNHSFVDRWTGPSFTVGGKRAVGQGIIDAILPRMADTLGLCEAG